MALDPLEGDMARAMSLNRYGYVESSVINAVDPSGMSASPKQWDSCYPEQFQDCSTFCNTLGIWDGHCLPKCILASTPGLQANILNSTVGIEFIPKPQYQCPDKKCNFLELLFDFAVRGSKCSRGNASLGTVVNGGIITHDHYISAPAPCGKLQGNENQSITNIQTEFEWMHIEGVKGRRLVPVSSLNLSVLSPGVLLISTPIATTVGNPINYVTYNAKPGDWVFFAYVPGENNVWFDQWLPHRSIELNYDTIYGDNTNAGREHEFVLSTGDIFTPSHTSLGDSGGGFFNTQGELIGVLRGEDWVGWLPGNRNIFNPHRDAIAKILK